MKPTYKTTIFACIWAVVPIINGVLLWKTPIAPLIAEGEKSMTLPELFRSKVFWVLIIMMVCSGALPVPFTENMVTKSI